MLDKTYETISFTEPGAEIVSDWCHLNRGGMCPRQQLGGGGSSPTANLANWGEGKGGARAKLTGW